MNVPRVSKHRLKFHISVIAGVLIIVAVMTFSTVAAILSISRRSAQTTVEHQFDLISSTVREKTISLLQPALDLATVSAYVPAANAPVIGDGMDHPARLFFTRMLKNQPAFYSSYIGFSDGTFFQVINADQNQLVVDAHDAPEQTDIIVRTITVSGDGAGQGDDRVQTWTFLDQAGEVLSVRTETEVSYDPRERPWYEGAAGFSEAVLSRPYVFNSLQQPGITASHPIPDGRGVVGVDLTISSLTSFVSSLSISPQGGAALYTTELDAISASPGMATILEDLNASGAQVTDRLAESAVTLEGDWLLRTAVWNVAANRDLVIMTSAPLADFMGDAIVLRRRIILISSIIVLVTMPFVFGWARRLSRALKELTTDAEKVGRMVFDGALKVQTQIHEFWLLAQAFGVMKATIAERTQALEDANTKLEMLVDMGIAMSAEFDINKLSEMILSGAKRLTNADGGSLYLANETRDQLEFQIVLNDSLGFAQGGTTDTPVGMHPVPLFNPDGSQNHGNVVTHTFHTARTENIPDAYEVGTYDFSGTRSFDEGNNYRSISFLTVPLKPRGGGDVLGALQLINAIDPDTGEVVPFSDTYEGLVEALSSAAAVAVQNWKLMERQKSLFDELVRFVAAAIDAKSPYTARHCARVPQIALSLSEAAEEATSGTLADFEFRTRDQRREFEIAAWLHDCGKITTPEYIVDKATKLETIYNRIHEVRTRFEVLLRDARIDRHEAVLAGADPAEADRKLAERERRLHDDFSFVANCNDGSEYMEDDALERLREISTIEWYRHFDNRIGLSWAEHRHSQATGDVHGVTLPAREYLLADRPEQIVPRENWTQERYDQFGFRFTVPEYLYNRGELYNLSVRSGTLTEEDRFKINEHVAQTIVMLDQIAFPDELRRVPEYAGSHHESPDGTGYPRMLNAEQLSVPSRILAIADIFEALLSTDRPYKRDKTLSETIEILHSLKQQNRIDPDLFELFLTSGAYRRCVESYLDVSQIDRVDIRKYVDTGSPSG